MNFDRVGGVAGKGIAVARAGDRGKGKTYRLGVAGDGVAGDDRRIARIVMIDTVAGIVDDGIVVYGRGRILGIDAVAVAADGIAQQLRTAVINTDTVCGIVLDSIVFNQRRRFLYIEAVA